MFAEQERRVFYIHVTSPGTALLSEEVVVLFALQHAVADCEGGVT